MNSLQKSACLLKLTQELGSRGSWCGETHIQKAVYFLQELLRVPTAFDFILYKHGPFSFDLRDQVTALRANGLLKIMDRPYPYSPSLKVTDEGKELCDQFQKTLQKYAPGIRFVADRLGEKKVTELERLATALYVTLEDPKMNRAKRAQCLHELKPHVAVEEAQKAIEMVDNYISEAKKINTSWNAN